MVEMSYQNNSHLFQKILIDEDFIIFRPGKDYRLNPNTILLRTDIPVLIDPLKKGAQLHNFLNFIRKEEISTTSIRYLFITHHHIDHLNDITQTQQILPKARTVIHESVTQDVRYPFLNFKNWIDSDYYHIRLPKKVALSTIIFLIGLAYYHKLHRIDYFFSEECQIQLGSDWVQLIPAPGHSKGLYVIRDNRHNLFLSDLIPSTPFIDPISGALEDMITSVRRLLRFNSTEIKRAIRGHGNIKNHNTLHWEVNPWEEEKARFQSFLETIFTTLERIPNLIRGHTYTVQQVSQMIFPNMKKEIYRDSRVILTGPVSWGQAYLLKLLQDGKVQSVWKAPRYLWTA